MKYIIYDDERIIIFDDSLSHHNVAFMHNIDVRQISSAGKLKLENNQLILWGESTTLHKKSQPEDINIIKFHLRES